MDESKLKIPWYCCIVSCRNHRKKTRGPTAHNHRIPANAIRREKWIAIITEQNGKPPPGTGYVCSNHFVPESYYDKGNLRYDAVPTIFESLATSQSQSYQNLLPFPSTPVKRASESESDQPRKVRQSLLQPVTISPNSVLENKNSTPAPVEKRPGTCGFLACRNHRVATKSATHHIHRLPSEPVRKAKWIAFITEKNGKAPVASFKTCSDHFEPSMYGPDNRLKSDAVPTLFSSVSTAPLLFKPVKQISLSEGDPPTDSNSCHSDSDQLGRSSGVDNHSSCDNTAVTPNSSPPAGDEHRVPPPRDDLPSTPQSTVRYIGDFHTPHFKTPRRASRNLKVLKEAVSRFKQDLKNQKRLNNRLRLKLKTMEDTIEHLKSEKQH